MKDFFVEFMCMYSYGVILGFLLVQFEVIENYSTNFILVNLYSALALSVLRYFYTKTKEKV